MRADHIALKLLQFARLYTHVRQQSDAGVDGIYRSVAQREFLHHGARAEHARESGGVDLHGLIPATHTPEFIEGQTGAVE